MTHPEEPERVLHCDFCSQVLTDTAWDFPADPVNFDTPRIGPGALGPIEGAIGSWLACEDCRALIILDKRGHLARRVADHIRATAPEFVAAGGGYIAMLMSVREVQDDFWAARSGPGVRIGADQLALIRMDPAVVREWRPRSV